MHELIITRETHVSREKLFAGWTQPELLPKWFCPKPWFVSQCQIDLRPGGTCKTIMNGPNGEVFPNVGVFLEVLRDEKLVFTDGYLEDWQPNPKLTFTAILTFETLPNGRTRYIARARHWTQEAMERHAAMGFVEGWNKAFDQLVELVG